MKPTIAAASLLAALCYASPLQSPNSKKLQARQGPGSFFAITGATGGAQPRLEIRDLEKTSEMWNLYLLAMTNFQAMDQGDLVSYYQIAGIHGMPWTSWDGVEGTTEGKGESERGYCPHAQLLFATWHRPYLILFEQQLQAIAKSIANQFPTSTRSTYQDAANKLRIPFWDWAKAIPTGQPVFPTALSNPQVSVTFPNGTTSSVDNPLYDYNFHPLDHSQINGTGCSRVLTPNGFVGGDPVVCDTFEFTIRNTDTAPSDHAGLDSDYRGILSSQRSGLYRALSQYAAFDRFTGSLETLHNPIHTKTWPGHMSPASVSAFDPMFWLHHANVDRQLALFQAVFPDTYMQPAPADSPTFTIEEGEMLNADSPLTPFHKSAAGDWWTSTNSRNIKDMGYTYPELVGTPPNATLVASIKAQYSGTPSPSTKTKRQDTPAPSKGLIYLAQVTLPLYGLPNSAGGSAPYDVSIFLGDVPKDARKWTTSDTFVGVASTLGGLNMQNKKSVTATVELSLALEKAGKKSDDKAVEYLKENLKWGLGLGNFEIPKDAVKDVEVSLISTEVEISNRKDVFDRWVGGFKEHAKIDA